MSVAIVFAIAITSAWYVLAHSEILRFLQNRYPAWLDRLLSCAACSGWWLGCIAAFVAGYGGDVRYLGRGLPPSLFDGVVLCGLISTFTTPILGAILLRALNYIEKLTHGDSNEPS